MGTALGELAKRISAIADGFARAKREDVASELYQVERALEGALRRLAKVADGLG